jgi:DnaJ-class molecular chaperone
MVLPSVPQLQFIWQITPGTSSHTRVRLTGKGLKKVNSYGYGDHYIHLKVKIPRSLNAKQKALLQAYAEIEDDTPGVVHGISRQKEGNFSYLKSGENLAHLLFGLCLAYGLCLKVSFL